MRPPRSPVRLSDAAAGISRTTRPPPAAPTVTPPRPCQPNGMISIQTPITVCSTLNKSIKFSCLLILCLLFLDHNGDSGTEGFAQLDSAQQDLENFHEIISEVYANNHQELAPCLDGLGAEAMQEASSATFSQMNFQGSGWFFLDLFSFVALM